MEQITAGAKANGCDKSKAHVKRTMAVFVEDEDNSDMALCL